MGPSKGKGRPDIRCNILEEKVAVWGIKRTKVYNYTPKCCTIVAPWLIERRIGTKDL